MEGFGIVTVIDGATNSTLPVAAGTDPFAVAVNPNTNQIYVANLWSNNVTVINGNAPWSADFVVSAGAGNGATITAGQSGTITLMVDAARLVYQPDQLLLHRIACTGRLHVQPCLGHPEFQHRNHDADYHYSGPDCVPSTARLVVVRVRCTRSGWWCQPCCWARWGWLRLSAENC
jgi:hypothetical protein